MKLCRVLILSLCCAFWLSLDAQQAGSRGGGDVVQLTGVVVTADSLHSIPYTHIAVKGSRRGAIADYHGFFSMVARKGDTIQFTSVGFEPVLFVLPDTLSGKRYSLMQVMQVDTFTLSETVIYPWPTVEQFKRAFVELDIPDDDLERARKNLAMAELRERAMQTDMDGSMNYKHYINQQTNQLYYAGQMPPDLASTLLNPFAWAEFIKAWREGRFRRDQ